MHTCRTPGSSSCGATWGWPRRYSSGHSARSASARPLRRRTRTARKRPLQSSTPTPSWSPVAVQREFYRHKLLYKYPSRSTNRGAWSAFKSRLTPRKASRPSQIAGKCRRKTTQQLHIPTCMYPLPTPRQSWTHSLPTPTTAVCVLHAVVVEWLLTLSGDDDGSESRTRRISHLRCEQSSKHIGN